jgi:hypothetical protein
MYWGKFATPPGAFAKMLPQDDASVAMMMATIKKSTIMPTITNCIFSTAWKTTGERVSVRPMATSCMMATGTTTPCRLKMNSNSVAPLVTQPG